MSVDNYEKYIFFCSCAEDEELVRLIAEKLQKDGCRIRYNPNSQSNVNGLEETAGKIDQAAVCLLFLSHKALQTFSFKMEMNYILNTKVDHVIPVYLNSDVNLTAGQKMYLMMQQKVDVEQNDSAEEICRKIEAINCVKECLEIGNSPWIVDGKNDLKNDVTNNDALKIDSRSENINLRNRESADFGCPRCGNPLTNQDVCEFCALDLKKGAWTSIVKLTKNQMDDIALRIRNFRKIQIFYYPDGQIKYEGEVLDGKREGHGVCYYANGNIHYDGEWKDGNWEGHGIKYYENGSVKITGTWENNQITGWAVSYYENGQKKYEGEFEKGKYSGTGTYYFEDGKKYTGSFKNNKYHGHGTSYYANGQKRYEGEYADGKWSGQGIWYYENGMKQEEGTWVDNHLNGEGILYYADGTIKYKGDWKEGKRCGKGTSYYPNGKTEYEGEWKNGKWNGQGTLFASDGSVRKQGIWIDNNLSGMNWELSDQGVLTISGNGPMPNYESHVSYTTAPWGKMQEKIRKVVVANGITSIGNNAFRECKKLWDVQLPNTLKRIGENAFAVCDGLYELRLPEGLEVIGEGAFFRCPFPSVAIPDSVTDITGNPFSNCQKLQKIQLSDNHKTFQIIEGMLYNRKTREIICCPCGKKDSNIIIPQGTATIGKRAFSFCDSIVTVQIPESVEQICDSAFSSCKKLLSISIPKNIRKISTGMFQLCSNLKHIQLPDGIQEIGPDAFYNTAIKKLILPAELKTIGKWAFCNCHELTSVKLQNHVISIGEFAFCKCFELTEMNLPESIMNLDENVFEQCEKLTASVVRGSYGEQYCKANNIKHIYTK